MQQHMLGLVHKRELTDEDVPSPHVKVLTSPAVTPGAGPPLRVSWDMGFGVTSVRAGSRQQSSMKNDNHPGVNRATRDDYRNGDRDSRIGDRDSRTGDRDSHSGDRDSRIGDRDSRMTLFDNPHPQLVAVPESNHLLLAKEVLKKGPEVNHRWTKATLGSALYHRHVATGQSFPVDI